MIRDIVVGALLLAGSTLMLFAAIGLVRFHDVLCRAHALGKATTFGVSLLIVALWLHLANEVSGLKLGLVLAFSLLTIPLASHLVALLLYRHGDHAEKTSDSNGAAKSESSGGDSAK